MIGPPEDCDREHPRAQALVGDATIEQVLRELAARGCSRFVVPAALLSRRVHVDLPADLGRFAALDRAFKAFDDAGVEGRMQSYVRLDEKGKSPSTAPLERVVHDETPAMKRKLAAGLRCDADGCRLDRKLFDELLADTTPLATAARFVPAIREGKPHGFTLYAIRPGSFYDRLGFKDGDVVTTVDGMALDTPDKALEVYTKIRDAKRHEIVVERGGATTTIRFTLTP